MNEGVAYAASITLSGIPNQKKTRSGVRRRRVSRQDRAQDPFNLGRRGGRSARELQPRIGFQQRF